MNGIWTRDATKGFKVAGAIVALDGNPLRRFLAEQQAAAPIPSTASRHKPIT
jgi:hypothetical protein